MKKYELTTECKEIGNIKLFRVKALTSFGNVKAGELGGHIEKEDNLSQDGNAWVGGNALVRGNALVDGNARVDGNAEVDGNARVRDSTWVGGNARVRGSTWVDGNAEVDGNALVRGDEDYTTIKGFGRECRNTTFFRQEDGSIGVVCGCLYGTLDEFRKKVRETHGESKYAKEYLMIADLMEMHFDRGEGK